MSAGFTFRLESVLDLRRRRERQLQEDLAVALQQQQQARLRLADLERERAAALAAIEAIQQAHVLDLSALLQAQAYADQLAAAVADQVRRVEEAGLVVANAQERLVAAAKETKSIERLRDQQWQAFQRALDRREEQRLGELALQQYIRRRREVA